MPARPLLPRGAHLHTFPCAAALLQHLRSHMHMCCLQRQSLHPGGHRLLSPGAITIARSPSDSARAPPDVPFSSSFPVSAREPLPYGKEDEARGKHEDPDLTVPEPRLQQLALCLCRRDASRRRAPQDRYEFCRAPNARRAHCFRKLIREASAAAALAG